jgi:ABC-type bacteriocin/lantibiotic exporter with double-glycine peptidase domain
MPIQQPNDFTCGPAAMKHALEIFGKKRSIKTLAQVCRTNGNGTSTKNIIRGFRKMGFFVLSIEKATLKHLQSALKYTPNQKRAVLVTYLYDLRENETPHPESGHWAMVASYSSRSGRIIVLDSASAAKKSYSWQEFRKRWKDYDLTRKTHADGSIALKKKWQKQLLLIIAKEKGHLPKFSIKTQKAYLPS